MEGPECRRGGKEGFIWGFPAPGQSLQGVEEVDSESSWSSYGVEGEWRGGGVLRTETELLLFLVGEVGESREEDKLFSPLQAYFCF